MLPSEFSNSGAFGKEEIASLYAHCSREEKKLHKKDLDLTKKELLDAQTFDVPLPRSTASIGADSPGRTEGRLALDEYQHLLIRLRTAPDIGRVWFILACWLREKGIREPREFLPPQIHRRLTAPVRKHARLPKPSELYYALLVEIWRPYFERLVLALRHNIQVGKRSVSDELVEIGFESGAVAVLTNPDRAAVAPIAAACKWLAARFELDENTLQTAHSLVFGRRKGGRLTRRRSSSKRSGRPPRAYGARHEEKC